MPKLTERRHRETRAEIARAAVALFAVDGYANVTMEQVADAAGVSRRTAYRHFPNKYDLVFEHPRCWLECFEQEIADDAAAGDPTPESTRDLCRRGILAVAALIEETAGDVIAAWRVFEHDETLRGHNAKTQAEWVAVYAQLLGADLEARPGAEVEVLTIAGSLVAMTNALCVVWAAQYPSADMVELTVDALRVIEPLWPEEARRARVR